MKLKWAPIKFALVGAMAVGVAGFARSCIIGILSGVHFRSNVVDFGMPPPRYEAENVLSWARPNQFRPGTEGLYAVGVPQPSYALAREWDSDCNRAFHEESADHYASAIAIYRHLNRLGLGSPGLERRVMLLTHAESTPHMPGLAAFLIATKLNGRPAPIPKEAALDPYLRPFVQYEVASRGFDAGRLPGAGKAYQSCATDFPSSPLAEMAMIMAVRCDLSVGHPSQEALARGESSAHALLSRYPRTRFRADALGWLGRASFLRHDYVSAESYYQRALAFHSGVRPTALTDSMVQCKLAVGDKAGAEIWWLMGYRLGANYNDSLFRADQFVRGASGLNQKECTGFIRLLARNPIAAASYLEVRLDLCTTTFKDRENLIAIGRKCSPVPAVLARISEAAYLNGDMASSKHFTLESLSRAKSIDPAWALAQSLFGGINLHSGDYRGAIRAYRLLVHRAPESRFAMAAYESLALAYDRIGDFRDELDQYYALAQANKAQSDYFADIAYLLDAKMSTSQIRGYIASHPGRKESNQWIYTLGLRYLRQGSFSKAIAVLARLTNAERKKLDAIGSQDDTWGDPIFDPLHTARELAFLTANVSHASAGNARASALYKLASYYYEKRDLLLYNASLWQFARVNCFDWSWNASVADNGDRQALNRHMRENDCLVHAYEICARIVKEYPNSPVAPKALYREACAIDHLGNLCGYWRWEGARMKTEANAASLLHELASKYSHSSLAKAASKYKEVFADEAADQLKQALANRSGKWDGELMSGWQ